MDDQHPQLALGATAMPPLAGLEDVRRQFGHLRDLSRPDIPDDALTIIRILAGAPSLSDRDDLAGRTEVQHAF